MGDLAPMESQRPRTSETERPHGISIIASAISLPVSYRHCPSITPTAGSLRFGTCRRHGLRRGHERIRRRDGRCSGVDVLVTVVDGRLG